MRPTASTRRSLPIGSGSDWVGHRRCFSASWKGTGRSEEVVTAPLYQEIDRLKMELEWLKKKL